MATFTFGPALLAELVREIQEAGYEFVRFDQPCTAPKSLYLRWDVDISPAGAMQAGELLHQHSVAANFFFQFNAETYSGFSKPVLDGIDRLRGQGHAVGLHFDQELLGEDEEILSCTLDWFHQCCRKIDRMVSFHRPTPSVLGRDYGRFLSTYSSQFFDPERYLSDSRRSLDFRPRLSQWLAQGRTPLQLLLHPEWWEPFDNATAIWKHLRQRRQAELEAYVLKAFAKVFTPVLEALKEEER